MSERGSRDAGRLTAVVVQLPLLDRLIDDAPDTQREPAPSAAETVEILRRSVRRDLEALLNARRRWRSWPDGYTELDTSPVGYGIPDFTAGAFNDQRRRDELRAEIEQTIRRFEPRLTGLRVSLLDGKNSLGATLHLRIDALLRVDPAPEPIAFDTLVDAATAEVVVRASAETSSRTPGDV